MIRNIIKHRLLSGNVQNYQQTAAAVTVGATASRQDVLPFSKIPKIPTIPLVGSSWIYFPLVGKYNFWKLHKANLQKYHDYGPVVLETFNNELQMLLSFDPEDYAKIFQNEGRYPVRMIVKSVKKYRDAKKDLYNNGGLLTTLGKEWWDVRSAVQPHMMKPKSVHAYIGAMDEVARTFTDRMVSLRDKDGGEVPNYLNELYKWALESVALVAFDARLGAIDPQPNKEGIKIVHSVNEIMRAMLKLEFGALSLWQKFPGPTYRRFEKHMDFVSTTAMKYITEAKQRLENAKEDHEITLLENLISTAKDPRDINAMLTDMILGGVDTTSGTVGFTLYHLARNPDLQEKAHQEIKSIVKDGPLTVEVLNNSRYLKACVKESMRLTPVVLGNARTLAEPTVMSGYEIPAGTIVFIQGYVTGQMEKYFPEPTKFRPERFLRSEREHDPFAFIPFGFGPRMCIGRRIAEQEIWILLIRLLERFRVEYHYEDIDMETRLAAAPDKPLRFQFYNRY